MKLTKNPCVAGVRVVHALQGGGPGLNGKYVKGKTWCGVEKRTLIWLVETSQPCTCKTCLRSLSAHRRTSCP